MKTTVRLCWVLLIASCGAGDGNLTDADNDALQKWESADLVSYRYIYESFGGACGGEPVEVVVTGEGVTVEDIGRSCLGAPDQASISRLFQSVEFARNDDLLTELVVIYDDDLGFPSHVSGNCDGGELQVADCAFAWTITEFGITTP